MTEFQPPEPASDWRQDLETTPHGDETIGRILLSGSDNLIVITDWDGVITPKEPDRIGATSFEIYRHNMPSDEHRALHRVINKEYLPHEAAGDLMPHQALAWQLRFSRLMIGASMDDIRHDAARRMRLRPGAKELFSACDERGIPIVINSTADTDLIRAVTDKHGLKPTHVIANRFITDGEYIRGFSMDELTHPLNKLARAHNTLLALGRTAAIKLGDNLHDIHMASGRGIYDPMLGVRIENGQAYHNAAASTGAESWEQHKHLSFSGGFGAVAVKPDLFAVTGLIRAVA